MASNASSPLDRLRLRARQAIAQNAPIVARGMGYGPDGSLALPVEDRAGRVWDLPAKMEVARTIMRDERRRSQDHNGPGDAMRHARASQRLTQATGPIFAEIAGAAHEVEDIGRSIARHGFVGPYDTGGIPTPGQTIDEIPMDLHNNAEGRRAAMEGREIDPARLRTRPSESRLGPLYRSPRAWRAGLPGR